MGLFVVYWLTFEIYEPENPVAMACLPFYTMIYLWVGWKRLRQNYQNSENKQEVKNVDGIEIVTQM